MKKWIHRIVLLLTVATVFVSANAQPRRAPKRPVPPQLIERLEKMTPEEREQALSQLPPARRALVERRLNHYERMPAEKREQARQRLGRFQRLPMERRAEVRREIAILRLMTPEDRKLRMTDPKFQERYSSEEQQLVKEVIGEP